METLLTNFTSPIVLAFVLGIVAKLIKSDLEFPRPIYQGLSIYLLLAIGLKGGVELSTTPFAEFVWPATSTLFLGILTPLTAYAVLRYMGKIDIDNSAGIAAHYGSVSAVTFIAAISYAETLGDTPEGFMPTLVALLEVPGIIVALMIPQLSKSESGSIKKAFHEVITGSSIVLLLGGLVVGYIAGPLKFEPVKPFFVNGFQGALVLFLLELGMITARRLQDLRKVGFFLLGF
ncbi:MAG TPA: sodium-dependent bicarbonate transport family permease, partial [Gracilimonas sp.]|nr:sodium-dependent bicarbonate transport family permease [Gracilimonas sp.]